MYKFMLALLLAVPFFGSAETSTVLPQSFMKHPLHIYGYFWVDDEQVIEGVDDTDPSNPIYDSVEWVVDQDVNSQGIHVNHEDPFEITIEKKGTYLATFILTGVSVIDEGDLFEVSDNPFLFALLLDDVIVPGSIYGNFPATIGIDNDGLEIVPVGGQLVGQAIFRVDENWAHLRLVNVSGTDFQLRNVSESPLNVTASLAIHRISKDSD